MTVVQFPKLREIPEGYISGPDLAKAAGITYRQLDYWSRTGILQAVEVNPGSGYLRAYPANVLAFARLLKRLLDGGVNLRPAVDLARRLLEHGHADLAGIRIELPQDL
jgi:DNA-binding transcriptional MerR regulator